jgi:hypothetical protein
VMRKSHRVLSGASLSKAFVPRPAADERVIRRLYVLWPDALGTVGRVWGEWAGA